MSQHSLLFAVRGAVVAAAWLGMTAAVAETLYVTDTLRVGVRPEPSARVAPTHVVTTGAALEVLERQDGYLRIRTPEGIEGWIKAVYAAKSPPARQQLATLREQHEALEKRFKELEASLQAVQEGSRTLSEEVERLQAENLKLRLELARSQGGDRNLRGAGPQQSFLAILAAVAALGAAFGLGYLWHHWRTRRFLGGHRL